MHHSRLFALSLGFEQWGPEVKSDQEHVGLKYKSHVGSNFANLQLETVEFYSEICEFHDMRKK